MTFEIDEYDRIYVEVPPAEPFRPLYVSICVEVDGEYVPLAEFLAGMEARIIDAVREAAMDTHRRAITGPLTVERLDAALDAIIDGDPKGLIEWPSAELIMAALEAQG